MVADCAGNAVWRRCVVVMLVSGSVMVSITNLRDTGASSQAPELRTCYVRLCIGCNSAGHGITIVDGCGSAGDL